MIDDSFFTERTIWLNEQFNLAIERTDKIDGKWTIILTTKELIFFLNDLKNERNR